MFYSELIVLGIGGLMEYIVAVVLTFKFKQYDVLGEKISIVLAWATIIVLFIWLPIVMILITFKFDMKILDNQKFKSIWGATYQDLNYKQWSSRAYYLIFFVRRFIFVFTAFYIDKSFIIQALIIIFMSILTLIYQGIVRPAETKHENNIENLNEFMVLIITETIFFQTEWIPTIEMQY